MIPAAHISHNELDVGGLNVERYYFSGLYTIGDTEERGYRGEVTQRRGEAEERGSRGEETQRRGDTEERRGDINIT
jgi:hypothetical protein